MAKAQRIVVTFSIILLVILLGSTIYAVFTEDNGAPFRVMSLRGEQVEIYGGNGLHAYDTVDKAIMMRAFDMYYLTVGIPLFIISLLLYIRRSIIGYFMLLSSLFFWLYNFIINSVGFSYNNFFLICG